MKKRNTRLAGTVAITLIAAASALRSGNGDSQADRQWISASAREEIKSVELEIDRIEDESLNLIPTLISQPCFITMRNKAI